MGNCKNSTKSFHVPFIQFPITIVQFQNQEIDIGTIQRSYADFTPIWHSLKYVYSSVQLYHMCGLM